MEERFFCEGFRCELKPWHCIQNQLSDFADLPKMPCWKCATPVTIEIAPAKELRTKGEENDGNRHNLSQMTRAVARSMGLI